MFRRKVLFKDNQANQLIKIFAITAIVVYHLMKRFHVIFLQISKYTDSLREC